MYEYDKEMSRSEYRAMRRAARRGEYPTEPANFPPYYQPPSEPTSQYNPAPAQSEYARQQYFYQRAASLVRQRVLLISNACSFLIVCAFLSLVWIMSGATYFWPGWIIVLWAIGLISQASAYFVRRNIG
jgi:hypothetical protein